jgi:hypothetical protein
MISEVTLMELNDRQKESLLFSRLFKVKALLITIQIARSLSPILLFCLPT